MRELAEFGEVQIDRDQCIVCVVGNFIAEQAGLIHKVFDAVKEVPVRMISYGGSKHNVSLLVHSDDKAPVLKMLNQELF